MRQNEKRTESVAEQNWDPYRDVFDHNISNIFCEKKNPVSAPKNKKVPVETFITNRL